MMDKTACLICARGAREDMRHFAKLWRRSKASAFLHQAVEEWNWARHWENKAAQAQRQEVAA